MGSLNLKDIIADGEALVRSGDDPDGSTLTADRAFTGGMSLTNNPNDDVGPEFQFHGYNGRWIFGVDVANAPTSRDFVPVGQINDYYLNDGATTNGSPTLTSASEGGFSSAIVGATLSGTGIPNGTTVSSVASATSLTMSANATATNTGVRVFVNGTGVSDIVYVKHRGGLPPTIGYGVTPPDSTARVQIAAGHATQLGMDGLRILAVASFSGKYLTLKDSGDVARFWINSDGSLEGNHSNQDASVVIKARNNANLRALVFEHPTSGQATGFYFGDNTTLTLRNFSSGADSFQIDTNGGFRHVSGTLGFYAASAVAKPTGVAVTAAGIHAALVTLGLIAA